MNLRRNSRDCGLGALPLVLLGFVWLAGSAAALTPASCSIPIEISSTRPDPIGTPTSVEVGVFVVDIAEIEDARQMFAADFYFSVRWRDHRLESFGGCQVAFEEIWDPQAVILNQRGVEGQLPAVVAIGADGTVEYKQRFFGELSSPFELRDFPFDVQKLPIEIVSMGHTPAHVSFAVDSRSGRAEEFSVAGWALELSEPTIGEYYVAPQARSLARIEFAFEASRKTGFYISKMLLPLTLIVMMAWCVFWIDPTKQEAQIGLSTATVFTLIAFHLGLGSLLPKVSYLTRADEFLLGTTLLVFLALGESIATGRLARQGREDLALELDRWARWLFALSYLLLAVVTLWL